jgi:segregation and condensation protein B
VSAAARRRGREGDEPLDAELLDLPPAARWREWMLRVEAAIFASAKPVPREALVRVVGQDCRFDELIADLIHELRGRPYDLTLVAGGYALRTKTRFAPAIRAVHPGRAGDAVGELTKAETFALTAIAYLQPVTRGEISKLAGREISRDVIASLKRHGLIDGAIRAPQPGAPFAYVTTGKFLETFGFATLRDCPTSNGSRPKVFSKEGRGTTTSTARSASRMRSMTHLAAMLHWTMSSDIEGIVTTRVVRAGMERPLVRDALRAPRLTAITPNSDCILIQGSQSRGSRRFGILQAVFSSAPKRAAASPR